MSMLPQDTLANKRWSENTIFSYKIRWGEVDKYSGNCPTQHLENFWRSVSIDKHRKLASCRPPKQSKNKKTIKKETNPGRPKLASESVVGAKCTQTWHLGILTSWFHATKFWHSYSKWIDTLKLSSTLSKASVFGSVTLKCRRKLSNLGPFTPNLFNCWPHTPQLTTNNKEDFWIQNYRNLIVGSLHVPGQSAQAIAGQGHACVERLPFHLGPTSFHEWS